MDNFFLLTLPDGRDLALNSTYVVIAEEDHDGNMVFTLNNGRLVHTISKFDDLWDDEGDFPPNIFFNRSN